MSSEYHTHFSLLSILLTLLLYFIDLRYVCFFFLFCFVFFQAEDGIRYLVRSRGLGDVYKRQIIMCAINVVLGYIFIFGHYGFPAMGISGAAYASAISEVLASLYALSIILSLIHI